MKRYIILFISVGVISVFLTSCLEKYLDKAPASGLQEDQVFNNYINSLAYFDAAYNNGTNTSYGSNRNIRSAMHIFFQMASWGIGMEIMTDMSDNCLRQEGTVIKGGNMGGIIDYFTYSKAGGKAILQSMFITIRRCNMTLKNIERMTDAKPEDKDDLIAQAHFIRAYCHFELFRWRGPMPYLTKPLDLGDQWDIPRLSKHETLIRIAADLDTAYTFYQKAGRMRRDPGPGQSGHLGSPDQFRPNGCAALALKARVLLYAASPLNNELGIADWDAAAKASWEAIQVAQQNSYALLSAADYKKNYIGVLYSNEQIWGYSAGTNQQNMIALGPPNECPTQNTVDKFGTKWGDPLNTQADRDAATALGHYDEQNPYINRDPRFEINVVYNTTSLPGLGTAKIYYEYSNGEIQYGELFDKKNYLSITNTGYYLRKTWCERNLKYVVTVQYTDPLLRLGELYLNYAEAANEAYGPNTPAPGATMSSVDAINFMRNGPGRWTTAQLAPVPVQNTSSKDVFRPWLKNERTIELAWEGHYFFDIRRWMDVGTVMSGKVMGVDIEKVPVSTTYTTGYKYTRVVLPSERQTVWKEAMYYWPFDKEDNWRMKNFVPNEVW